MASASFTQSPILTTHLFPKLEGMLIELLQSLTPEEWEKPTTAPRWRVRDVASHLLDTQIRKLSIVRDGYLTEKPHIESNADLAAYVNRLNDDGVRFYGRLSPPVLISLMQLASKEVQTWQQTLDPYAPASFPVSWAGESESPNWFDIARDFTERWHHQQQIRLAVDRPGIMTREFLYPVLDCFMRALPYAYRTIDAPLGTTVRVEVLGEGGGTWTLVRLAGQWRLRTPQAEKPSATVKIPQEIAWRIFTKGIDRESARQQVTIDGDEAIGAHLLQTLAIVA